jgi:hypothetical protein
LSVKLQRQLLLASKQCHHHRPLLEVRKCLGAGTVIRG